MGDISLTAGFGVGLAILIGFVLGFTHGAPTPENSSPPPEAFDYPFGILVGLAIATVGRIVGWPLWRSRRRRDG